MRSVWRAPGTSDRNARLGRRADSSGSEWLHLGDKREGGASPTSRLPIILRRRDVPINEQGETRRGIVVGNDVWNAAHATIMDRGHVGRGAVVAAGAVVNRDVPP